MELTVVGYVLVIDVQRKDSGYTGERMLKMDEEKKTTEETRLSTLIPGINKIL